MGSLYAELVRTLTAAGCVFVRHGKGSHEIWRSPITGRVFTVPRSLKSRHLAAEILKQAGIAPGPSSPQ